MVAAGAPNIPIGDIFPLIAMFAVANSALINMMMASRLLYGMAKQQVLPPVLGRVLEGRRTPWVAILFTTAIAVGLLLYVGSLENAGSRSACSAAPPPCCCSRCSPWSTSAAWCCAGSASEHRHFRAPTVMPILGALCCAYLVGAAGPAAIRGSTPSPGLLLAIGVVLWLITYFINRAMWGRQTYVKDPEALEGIETKP